MANNIYYSKVLLTGGGATALDSIDGDSLTDGDFAYVHIAGIRYTYRLNATSGAAEASPSVIAPDTNAGTKRWILQTSSVLPKVADATLSGTPVILTIIGSDGTTYYIKGYPTKA